MFLNRWTCPHPPAFVVLLLGLVLSTGTALAASAGDLTANTSQGNRIKASDVQDIRAGIDARRNTAACGSLGPYPWATGVITAGVPMRAAQINEIKTALTQAPFAANALATFSHAAQRVDKTV